MTPCKVVNGGASFSVSTANTKVTGEDGSEVNGQSQNFPSNCNNDYVIFPGGYDPAVSPLNTPTNALDRYCGEVFNPGKTIIRFNKINC